MATSAASCCHPVATSGITAAHSPKVPGTEFGAPCREDWGAKQRRSSPREEAPGSVGYTRVLHLCARIRGSHLPPPWHSRVGVGGLRGVLFWGFPRRGRGQADAQSHRLHLGHFPEAFVVFRDLEGTVFCLLQNKTRYVIEGLGGRIWGPVLGHAGTPR